MRVNGITIETMNYYTNAITGWHHRVIIIITNATITNQRQAALRSHLNKVREIEKKKIIHESVKKITFF